MPINRYQLSEALPHIIIHQIILIFKIPYNHSPSSHISVVLLCNHFRQNIRQIIKKTHPNNSEETDRTNTGIISCWVKPPHCLGLVLDCGIFSSADTKEKHCLFLNSSLTVWTALDQAPWLHHGITEH